MGNCATVISETHFTHYLGGIVTDCEKDAVNATELEKLFDSVSVLVVVSEVVQVCVSPYVLVILLCQFLSVDVVYE
jgi:hypothetical protein